MTHACLDLAAKGYYLLIGGEECGERMRINSGDISKQEPCITMLKKFLWNLAIANWVKKNIKKDHELKDLSCHRDEGISWETHSCDLHPSVFEDSWLEIPILHDFYNIRCDLVIFVVTSSGCNL